jgi:hypothetical protein
VILKVGDFEGRTRLRASLFTTIKSIRKDFQSENIEQGVYEYRDYAEFVIEECRMQDINNCDLITLFTLRYALDKPDDIVNLKFDILDLQNFPERLDISYEAEWRTYVKRAIHSIKTSRFRTKKYLEAHINELLDGTSEEFNTLLEIVKTAMAVNNSTQVTVINSPLKTYVQQLLKL